MQLGFDPGQRGASGYWRSHVRYGSYALLRNPAPLAGGVDRGLTPNLVLCIEIGESGEEIMKATNSFRGLIFGILVTLLLAVFAQTVISRADYSREAIPVFGQVPPFQFTERSGKMIDHTILQGRISILDFIFTTCQGPCPMMARVMGSLHDYYVNSPQVQFFSVTVDPETDTPEVLQQYASNLGITDQRWMFLRGEIGKVQQFSEEGFKLPAEGLPYGHSIKFVLIDQQGQIRGYYDSSDAAAIQGLRRNIRQLALVQR